MGVKVDHDEAKKMLQGKVDQGEFKSEISKLKNQMSMINDNSNGVLQSNRSNVNNGLKVLIK